MKTTSGLATVLVMGSLCAGACARKLEGLSATQREAIQARVTNMFEYTVLFTPPELETNSPLALRLAPLIIQKVADTNSASLWRDQFGTAESGLLVTCESSVISIHRRPHDQYSYSWSYAATNSSARKSQGIRITLNAAGEPVIWEVLDDSSGAKIIYVAQSVELAARAEFGAPLPGRRFSIERSVVDAPNAVVANVIDDGPVPMGPVVYLLQQSHDVSTLICRCMASQGGTLLGQTNYELRPALPPNHPPGSFPAGKFEASLRLPGSF